MGITDSAREEAWRAQVEGRETLAGFRRDGHAGGVRMIRATSSWGRSRKRRSRELRGVGIAATNGIYLLLQTEELYMAYTFMQNSKQWFDFVSLD